VLALNVALIPTLVLDQTAKRELDLGSVVPRLVGVRVHH
jgi:hypothetical protein